MAKKLALITNDDGLSKGLLILIESAIAAGCNVVAVVPESQQSAVGKKITYHKPLKLQKIRFHGHDIYLISGTPADAIAVAINMKKFLPKKPDIVATGINSGFNVSIHSILSSGTVGAAIEGATYNIPSMAFSAMSKAKKWYNDDAWPQPDAMKKWTTYFISQTLKHGLPSGCDVLNVIYPLKPATATCSVCVPQLQHFAIEIEEEKRKYAQTGYWIAGKGLAKAPAGQDVGELMKNKIVVTP
ncbi:MAG TPA: 5'/3'-nucleotidase SurE, partial [Candidatus Micrarchaeota archaeon]|nr:5'/3'-nucleotidase SurE [Candidatus Micrarchaeota archaeon]